ncbi:hypothetical protein [Pseudomonas sp. LP_7_YM]|uniref:hypothetical protein n=1 Tax=Pseudomonas sp. LP_7_YM TaxID=2485137 RepID=UPI00105FF925|nr:hypothetical protein [Pseudomonas sp. LP_7_YM]
METCICNLCRETHGTCCVYQQIGHGDRRNFAVAVAPVEKNCVRIGDAQTEAQPGLLDTLAKQLRCPLAKGLAVGKDLLTARTGFGEFGEMQGNLIEALG